MRAQLLLVADDGTIVARRVLTLDGLPVVGHAVELTADWPGIVTQVLWKLDGSVEIEVGADEHPTDVELSLAGWSRG